MMDGDENFSLWIESIAKGSKINAETTLRRMGRVCARLQVTQNDLARMSRGQAGGFRRSVVSRLDDEGNGSLTIAGYVKSLREWWRFNDLDVTRQVMFSRDVGLQTTRACPPIRSLTLQRDQQSNPMKWPASSQTYGPQILNSFIPTAFVKSGEAPRSKNNR